MSVNQTATERLEKRRTSHLCPVIRKMNKVIKDLKAENAKFRPLYILTELKLAISYLPEGEATNELSRDILDLSLVTPSEPLQVENVPTLYTYTITATRPDETIIKKVSTISQRRAVDYVQSLYPFHDVVYNGVCEVTK